MKKNVKKAIKNNRLPFFWIALHSFLVIAVLISWFTGMRIALVSRDNWAWLSPLLPQGELHSWHLMSGLTLLIISVAYGIWVLFQRSQRIRNQQTKPNASTGKTLKVSQRYHRLIQWLGYGLILSMVGTGTLMAMDLAGLKQANWMILWHFYGALGLAVYLLLHGGIYYIEYGLKAFQRIVLSQPIHSGKPVIAALSVLGIAIVTYQFYWQEYRNTLAVQSIALEDIIDIDGLANEPQWRNIAPTTIASFGGANFVDGQTEIRVKALSNGIEAFFHIEWDDPTKSLTHLPLVKTESGWQVQGQGFYRFDERQHYEDKFAIITSQNCAVGAAATAHLGPKPLADKPANWHGKGYHYRKDSAAKAVDLWHWKAVRTNTMMQIDDNHIATPYPARPGSRRYTAGYTPDGKESGAYVMNWQWYKTTGVTPKRLPTENAWLSAYQPSSQAPGIDQEWVMPWFGSMPYSSELDHYPVGTLMPSVIYRSNQFEGDRGDIRAHGVWRDGVWSLELARALKSGSEHDVDLSDNTCLWFAAFDHAQIAHTRHNRPLALKFMEPSS